MQAVKDKLHDMNEMRKAKAEAKAEEKVIKKKYHMMITYKNFHSYCFWGAKYL